MIASITFNDDFEEGSNKFRRNNRSTGQKSLRCFPRCCDQGHKAQGFCGQSIYATAVLQKSLPIETITIVGEIRPEAEPGMIKDVGKVLPKEEVLRRIRSSETKYIHDAETQMLIAGKIYILNESADKYSASIVLNESLISYDYCWKSNRWSSGIVTHVVDIVVLFDGSSDGGLTVLGGVSSKTFVISSTKSSKAATAAASEEEMTGKKRKETSNNSLFKIKSGKSVGLEDSMFSAFDFHVSESPLYSMAIKTPPTGDNDDGMLIFILCCILFYDI